MNLGRPSSKEYQNGIQKPLEGSKASKVWALCAGYAPKIPTRSEIISKAIFHAIPVGTATHQYSAWIRFNGLKAPKADSNA